MTLPRENRNRAPLTRRTRRPPPGAPPGTFMPDPDAPKPIIRAVCYDSDAIEETAVSDPAEVRALLGRRSVTWINVDGLGDVATVRALGEIFGLHNLTLEDVLSPHQRAKVEDYQTHVYIVVRMPAAAAYFHTEQLSIFLGEGFVLTFQEKPGDCFDPVRERLQRPGQPIRERGADYLAYALIDAVIDAYFPILEGCGEHLEALEGRLIEDGGDTNAGELHRMKRELLNLRRAVWPTRDMVNALIRDTSGVVGDQTRVYLRDCYDHTAQLMDMIETYREVSSGLIDLRLSAASQHLNEVIKVLTIIATIFIPLTFIAGVYGMNFDPDTSPWNMPELRWALGYPYSLLLMAAVAGGMVLYFRRRGWIGQSPRARQRRRAARRSRK